MDNNPVTPRVGKRQPEGRPVGAWAHEAAEVAGAP